MSLRSLANKLRGIVPFRADAKLKKADDLDRRMIRNAKLFCATGVGLLAYTVQGWRGKIEEWDKLNAKNEALSRIQEKLNDLDNLPDDEARANAITGVLYQLIDLGEKEAVLSMLKDVEKMLDAADAAK